MLAGESAHLTFLGLIAGTGVYSGLGKSAPPNPPICGGLWRDSISVGKNRVILYTFNKS